MTLRPAGEDDLPTLFEIQLDEEAQHLAAFVGEAARDREAYLDKYRKILANPEITTKVVEIDGEVVGSVAVFPMEGDIELTYWIRKDMWGRGVATAAVAALLEDVTVRPIHARVVEDNTGSARVLERNGFVRIGSDEGFAEARQATVAELIYKLSG
ncbi:MAG: GNAT family N-acetyltransferase [Catenulispora sp.]|nr:GNAT family N-acetyltransferase [Catenulispora sp.]